jgi:hypothetical protein
MYNEFATYAKDDDMLLTEEDNYPADNFDILSTEESEEEEHPHSFSSVNRRDNVEKVDDRFVLLKKFIEINTSETTHDAIPICNHSIAETSIMESKQKVVKKPKSRGFLQTIHWWSNGKAIGPDN